MPMFRETAGNDKWDKVKRVRMWGQLWSAGQALGGPCPPCELPARRCSALTPAPCPNCLCRPQPTLQFVMGSLAMKATERDPDFLKNFEAAVGGNKRKTGAGRDRCGAGVFGWCMCGRCVTSTPSAPTLHTHAVIVSCAVGGTLSTIVYVAANNKQCKDPDRSFGRETRSLKVITSSARDWQGTLLARGGGAINCSSISAS